MLVRYLRDSKNRPFATIVAINKDSIGVSICNTEKDCFNKQRGRQIAVGRAERGHKAKIPNRRVECKIYRKHALACLPGGRKDTYVSWYNAIVSIEGIVDQECDRMQEKADRYFKAVTPE